LIEHVDPTGNGVVDAGKVAVADPERLRDYFRRLGARAEVVDGYVHVELLESQHHRNTIAEYLRFWLAATEEAPVDAPRPEPSAPPARPAQPASTAAPTDAFARERPRLGDLLLAKGLITAEQLAEGLAESREKGELLGRVLIRRGFVFEDELARTLAAQLGLPYVNLRVVGVDPPTARMLPVEEGTRVGAIPIGYRNGQIAVAFADPSDDGAQQVVQRYVGTFDVAVADMSDIDLAWRSVLRVLSYSGDS
jgi:hypothetical protein